VLRVAALRWSNVSCALLAQRSNAQRSVCVNTTIEIHRVIVSRAAARSACMNGPSPLLITMKVKSIVGGVLISLP